MLKRKRTPYTFRHTHSEDTRLNNHNHHYAHLRGELTHSPYYITEDSLIVDGYQTTINNLEKYHNTRDGFYIFVMAIGTNTNKDNICNSFDMSPDSYVQRAIEGKYSLNWLTKNPKTNLCVVYISATDESSEVIDENLTPRKFNDDYNYQSPYRRKIIRDMYGLDTFSGSLFEKLILRLQIPLYRIENNATPKFFEDANSLIDLILRPYYRYKRFINLSSEFSKSEKAIPPNLTIDGYTISELENELLKQEVTYMIKVNNREHGLPIHTV